MTPERWRKIRAAVEAALLQTGANGREEALRQACLGDDSLLSEARSILSAVANTGGFLASPPEATLAEEPAASRIRGVEPGQVLAHYRIEERLGAGGMGEVFRARDLALGRDAALKVLRPQVAPDLRQRLLREARAAAKLQHPAIATFFEAGEDGGEAFIAMEFVRGESLRARLLQGPLSFDEAMALASCLLGALGHAHAAGLLHRDIKPDNVMVTSARAAKLLDFGIACGYAGMTGDLGARLTEERALIGTPGYMSPEQALGEPLDARSDLFQAAAVLYECLTARPAFPGATAYERINAALSRDVDLSPLRGPSFPAGLTAILERALARDRERRYPTAMAFLRELASLGERQADSELPRAVAVLDFDAVEADAELDWLGPAVAGALGASLSRSGAVELVPRNRIARARTAGMTPSDLGLQLGCAWVLSGTYERDGERLRLAARLTEVATGRHWALDPVEGALDDIFALQRRLAEATANRLRLSVPSAGAAAETPQVRAYELVSRARALASQFGRDTLEHAIDLLTRALDVDAEYAPAHGDLARAHALHAISTTDTAELETALRHADRAIALDPREANGHVWKGYALWRVGRWHGEGEAVLRRAVDLAPQDFFAHYFMGVASFLEGAKRDALPFLQRAVELEPLFAMGWLALGADHLSLMNVAEARYAFGRCLDLERSGTKVFSTAGAAAFIAEALRIERRLDEARELALKGIEAAEASDHPYRDTFRAYGLCVLGRIALQQGDGAAARAAFGQVIAQLRGRTRPRSCGHLMVQALAGLGRAGDAAAFEEAVELFETQHTWNFERFNGCLPEQGLMELARAAAALGRQLEAERLLERAREGGSLEPLAP